MYSPRELKGPRGGPPGCGEGLGQGGGIQAWVDSGHEPLLSVPWTKVGAREAGGQGPDVSVHISKLTAMPPEARGLGAAPRGEVSPTSPWRGNRGLKVPCPVQTPRRSDLPQEQKAGSEGSLRPAPTGSRHWQLRGGRRWRRHQTGEWGTGRAVRSLRSGPSGRPGQSRRRKEPVFEWTAKERECLKPSVTRMRLAGGGGGGC